MEDCIEGVRFLKTIVFYALNWTTDVLLPLNQNSNRTKFVGVDFLKVHRFSFLVLVVKELSLTCGKSMM